MSAAFISPDHTFTCIRCKEPYRVYALDPEGDARALLRWTCPNCTDLARRRDDSDDVLGGPSLAEVSDAGAVAAWLLGGLLVACGFIALLVRDLVHRLP